MFYILCNMRKIVGKYLSKKHINLLQLGIYVYIV